ncbi:MAG: alkaline phosphatase [Candidatus Thorarchaeota archaeon]|jgi:alkaline phosphatase
MKFRKTILLAVLLASFILTPSLQYATAASEYSEPLSVILMIGDGMGYEHIKLAKWVELGKNANLTLETLPYAFSIETHSASADITDSAAAATAYATGEKTDNDMVSIAPNGTELMTILEMARDNGKATGVITTTSIQHGTPAAFMTHVESRGDFASITRQIIESAGADVLMGGGSVHFSSDQIEFMVSKGYAFADSRAMLNAISTGMILGLFAEDGMTFEQDRDINLIPSLAEMTDKSLDILSQDDDGFFLMVEGGRIDHAGHGHSVLDVALETIAFDNAVEVALNFVEENSNTILIVTADHETGGFMITGDSLSGELPSDDNTEMENRAIRIARAESIDASWSTGYHTDVDVPLFIYGDVFENYVMDDVIDNTELFDIMDDYFSGKIQNSVAQLPITLEMIAIIAGTGIIIILGAYLIKLRRNT